ncbi:MAG: phosphonate ABC transporter ATP-binding protein [Phycisphaeraceae bacterium]|nr:phosphonate ABC transporter ATP-binding protein [Phycisphaeraceae bacterium]
MRYGAGPAALSGLNLSIHAQERIAVIGPSGAGKSTLLRLMNRLMRPTIGQVLLDGRDITHVHGRALCDVRHQVGMIFQQFNLVGRLTVLQNVMVGRLASLRLPWSVLALGRVFPGAEADRAMACLEEVRIADLAHRRADRLSGGQAQRVAIARVLAQEPRAILADEPIASLDPSSASIVLETLERIHHDRGVPIVINLHHVDIAQRFATRVVALRAGRLCWDAPADRVDPDRLAALYGDAPDRHARNDVDRLGRALETVT